VAPLGLKILRALFYNLRPQFINGIPPLISMKRTLLIFVLTGLVNFSTARASSKPDFDTANLSDAGRKAYAELLNASVYSVGGIGYSGSMSHETELLRTLLREAHAIEALRSLVQNGSPEGSLYGLVGLHVRNRELFDEELKHLKSKGEPVAREVSFSATRKISLARGEILMHEGCLWMTMERRQILTRIEAGQYDQFARWFSAGQPQPNKALQLMAR
jgi:hypothetical protein